MILKNSYDYIVVGLAIRLLINVKETDQKVLIFDTLNKLEDALKYSNFNVSMSLLNSPRMKDLIHEKLNKLEDTDAIGKELATNINNEFNTIERTVYAEALISSIYILPNRRFNSEYLLNEPYNILSDGIYDKLNAIAQQDISSACRCVLFGEATAAAFHILRATEDVLKTYYYYHRRQNRLSKPMWANMLDQLKAKTRNKPPIALLDALDLIRNAYRNPTQHPDALYDIDRAQDLLGVCIDVINQMGSELPDNNE